MYKWKDGAQLRLDAQVCGEHLEQLRVTHDGRLTPELVVSDASDAHSPLHLAFEWNDQAAASAYRMDQARYLLRSVMIMPEGGAPEVRAFVTVVQGEDSGKSYTHVIHAMQNSALRSQVLTAAKKELEDWDQRYRHLEEFASVHHAIQAVHV